MSFDHRWRALARAASRLPEPPLPPAPDGARLLRVAAAAPEQASPPWARSPRAALALSLLWAASVPALGPAWRAVREMSARVPLAAPAVPRCETSSCLPSPPAVAALARPRPPSLEAPEPALAWLQRLDASQKERTP